MKPIVQLLLATALCVSSLSAQGTPTPFDYGKLKSDLAKARESATNLSADQTLLAISKVLSDYGLWASAETTANAQKSPNAGGSIIPNLHPFKDPVLNKWGFVSDAGRIVISPKYSIRPAMLNTDVALVLNDPSSRGADGEISLILGDLTEVTLGKYRSDFLNEIKRSYLLQDSSAGALSGLDANGTIDFFSQFTAFGGSDVHLDFISKKDDKVNYTFLGDFHDGYAWVLKNIRGESNTPQILMEADGTETNIASLSGIEFNWVGDVGDGLIAMLFSGNQKIGFIDLTGKVVIKPKFEPNGEDFDSAQGRYVPSPKTPEFHNGRILYYDADNGLVISLDKTGKTVSATKVKFGKSPSYFLDYLGNGYYVIKTTELQKKTLVRHSHIFDSEANEVGTTDAIPRAVHARFPVSAPSGGLLFPAVKGTGLDEQWGFIDQKGKWIISPRYKSVEDFIGGIAFVTTAKGDQVFIDSKGTVVFDPMQ